MLLRRVSFRDRPWLPAAGVLLPVSFAQTVRRPLNHNHYARWRAVAAQPLRAGGKFPADAYGF
jgi:hypothetical protein